MAEWPQSPKGGWGGWTLGRGDPPEVRWAYDGVTGRWGAAAPPPPDPGKSGAILGRHHVQVAGPISRVWAAGIPAQGPCFLPALRPEASQVTRGDPAGRSSWPLQKFSVVFTNLELVTIVI